MSSIGEVIAKKEGIDLSVVDERFRLEFMEDLNKELNGTAGLELAEWQYKVLREKLSLLNPTKFLEVFNKLTEDNRCLIPENYPLNYNKEFQIDWMYENRKSLI